jgi:uncharacterized coiled-coil protein SlyX
MQDVDDIKTSIIELKKHIESQDIEVYRQQRLIDALQQQMRKLLERIESLEQGGAGGGMPADEKPPHY